MLLFIIKRIIYGFLVLIGVVFMVFFIFHALPGDPVAMLSGQRTDVATREAITRELGLDQPLHKQLALYLSDLSFISIHEKNPENKTKYGYTELADIGSSKTLVLKRPYLRRSFQNNRRVDDILFDNIGNTFWLASVAMLIASIMGISLGVFSALNRNRFPDHLLISFSVLGMSVPTFLLAILISLLFGYYLSKYTGLNLTGQLWQNDPVYGRNLHLENLILPAFTLSIRPLSIIIQITRISMLDVLSKDYIRTAYAKGLNRNTIYFKHALKNALNPVVTAISGWMATLMAGAFFVEYIFDWKGLGFITIYAVQSLDFPVVMGSTLLVAFIFIIINILADILYAFIDPRIRLS